MSAAKTSTRGGARPGAGRPRRRPEDVRGREYSLPERYHEAIAGFAARNGMPSSNVALELIVDLALAADTVDARARAARLEIPLPAAVAVLMERGAAAPEPETLE